MRLPSVHDRCGMIEALDKILALRSDSSDVGLEGGGARLISVSLDADSKELIEWLASAPPSPRRVDAFFGQYWSLLHASILIERLIGRPPTCSHRAERCEICGQTPQAHAEQTRRAWLRAQLQRRMHDDGLVENSAQLVEAAQRVRNRMAHRPHFDRSTTPAMQFHLQTSVYDTARAAEEFTMDSHALEALNIGLHSVAHSLIVDEAFGLHHFEQPRSIAVIHITRSGRVF